MASSGFFGTLKLTGQSFGDNAPCRIATIRMKSHSNSSSHSMRTPKLGPQHKIEPHAILVLAVVAFAISLAGELFDLLVK